MIKIHLIGDIMLGRSFNKLFSGNINFDIWTNIKSVLRNSDFVIGNLETTITSSLTPYPNKMFNFKLDPEYRFVIKKINISHLNIANNHILDYGKSGMIDTINYINSLGITSSGAGLNLKEAAGCMIHDVRGVKIGIISYSDHYDYWKASVDSFGINYVDISKKYDHVLKYIGEIKLKCDILIMSIHHGPNYVENIPEQTRKFFRDTINHGVDIVHGHSAHHILPLEIWKGKYIFYSMGDFIDDYMVDPLYRNDLAFIAELNIVDKKISSHKIYPTKININFIGGILSPYVKLIDKSDLDYQLVMSNITSNLT